MKGVAPAPYSHPHDPESRDDDQLSLLPLSDTRGVRHGSTLLIASTISPAILERIQLWPTGVISHSIPLVSS